MARRKATHIKQVCMDKKRFDVLNKANRLKTLYKTLAIIFIVSTIGVSAFFIGYTINPPTFQLTISFSDFYVENIDNSEKNYSYYIQSFEITGATFRQTEWDILKNMNATDFIEYGENNNLFLEQSIWGIVGSSMNINSSGDNNIFITRHTPIVLILDFRMTIWNSDHTEFRSEIFSLFYQDFFTNPTMKLNDYPYKSISGQHDISINFSGCKYNYTSMGFVNLLLEYNGIEKEVFPL